MGDHAAMKISGSMRLGDDVHGVEEDQNVHFQELAGFDEELASLRCIT